MDEKTIIQLLEKDTFSVINGIRIVSASLESGVAMLEVEDRHLNPSRRVHGGCIYTMADIIGGACTHMTGEVVTTTSGNLHYLRDVREVPVIYAKATLVKGGRKIMVYEVRITDDHDKLYALGTFTYYRLGIPLEDAK